MSREMDIYQKPTIGCLLTHQSAWDYLESQDEFNIHYCSHCDRCFNYPTKKEHHPIYRLFL